MTITNDTNNKATLPEIQLDSWALKHTQNHHLPFGDRLNPRRQDYYDDEEHGTFVYHSRPNRKNRLMEFEPDRTYWTEHLILPPLPRLIAFDLTNISWHVAIWFTLGSICWIINGQVFLWSVQPPPHQPAHHLTPIPCHPSHNNTQTQQAYII